MPPEWQRLQSGPKALTVLIAPESAAPFTLRRRSMMFDEPWGSWQSRQEKTKLLLDEAAVSYGSLKLAGLLSLARPPCFSPPTAQLITLRLRFRVVLEMVLVLL